MCKWYVECLEHYKHCLAAGTKVYLKSIFHFKIFAQYWTLIPFWLQRVAESTDAHNKLQSNLSKTMQEIYDQEKHIAQLKKAIRDKEAPLKVIFVYFSYISFKNIWSIYHIILPIL